MDKKNIALIVAAIGALIYFILPGGDPVIERMEDFVEEFRTEAPENNIGGALKGKSLSEYFDSTVTIKVPAYRQNGVFSRKDIMQLIIMGRQRYKKIDADLVEPEVTSRTNNSAMVKTAVKFVFDDTTQVKQFNVGLKKVQGVWVFTSCEELQLLEK